MTSWGQVSDICAWVVVAFGVMTPAVLGGVTLFQATGRRWLDVFFWA
jgi:hypothetical protein